MIKVAVDTSTLIAFWAGDNGEDINKLISYLDKGIIVLPPVVFSEILSDYKLPNDIREVIFKIEIIEIKEDFWYRAGIMRAELLRLKYKARLADTLISQSCIDHKVPLITRDDDFLCFKKYFGLEII